MRYLGLDPGGKRIGVAIGDESTGLVSPVAVLPYRGVQATVDALRREIERFDAAAVVIGLPTGVDGEETPACRRSRALADAFEKAGIATALQPEYLTTFEARQRARRCGRRAGEPVDDLAAQVLLEEFLNNQVSGFGNSMDPP